MKSSMAYGLVLFSVLMALSMGVAFAQETAVEENIVAENAAVENIEAEVADEDASEVAADDEVADVEEVAADNTAVILIDNVSYANQSVEISNAGEAAFDMTNWTLSANNETIFTFPALKLAAKSTVMVIAGNNITTETEIYTGSDEPLFAEAPVDVYLNDAAGKIIAEFHVKDVAAVEEAEETVEETTEEAATEVTESSTEEAAIEEVPEDDAAEETAE